ncbi:cytochrome c biogenesis CcdA family protein [Methylocystis sp.]|uniref:cytochrome c biogenesis CcdA family protein n=1 Tax=Methylocystis sp. TaxID=1911079 RepID=UPI0011D69F2C|nr:cytochrome c biogenesis protein CcdA [Methylocystis sp.]KAF0127240.1 MAG: cytochrome c bioproteinis protein transmembrane region [Methylocystaceae bacterium]KAF0210957.1 MAG: cytochrome c bioproteinis protein transmembrane [Methylocystaceae bacterium]MDP3553465.1 cytochrome c biogenesis protein CcdA [Methylocystis sp.]TXT43979.1 MAG: cytochrome c bioproteinis protein transmembrane region [Methylocystaceae bacterium]
MADVTFPAAAAAGLLSFLSPCVLPLVPPYLTYLAGVSMEDLELETRSAARRDILLSSILFVLGFTTVFVALGATASAFGGVLRANMHILSWVAGGIIILMGLHFIGLLKVDLLYREKRAEIAKPMGLFGSYVMGLAFAFGWTPCIGPILAAILAVAGTQETVPLGAALLATYSLGLGLPFIGAGLALGRFLAFVARFRRHFGKVEKVVGVLLVFTGIAFLTGGVQEMSYWLLELFPGLARLG